jgi:hypothetical protein
MIAIDRRAKLYSKLVFKDIDTHKTKFVLFDGWSYRIPIIPDQPTTEHPFRDVKYEIEVVKLERYAYSGKHRRAQIIIGYSQRADTCILHASQQTLAAELLSSSNNQASADQPQPAEA